MRRDTILYILSDIVSKGSPILVLFYLGVTLDDQDVSKLELIYVLQGLFINVFTFGQLHMYSKHLTYGQVKPSSLLMFGPMLITSILAVMLESPILLYASLASLMQSIYNMTQIYNNIKGEMKDQRLMDVSSGLIYSFVVFILFSLSLIDYKLKVLSQIICLLIVFVIFRKLIKKSFNYVFHFISQQHKASLPFVLISLFQWLVLFFDKVAGREILPIETSNSYFLFSLITNTAIVFNLSILKVVRRLLHNMNEFSIQKKLSSFKTYYFISFGLSVGSSVVGSLVLFILDKELSLKLIFLNTLICVLFTVFNYLMTFVIQGTNRIFLTNFHIVNINISLVLLCYISIYYLVSFEFFLLMIALILVFMNSFLMNKIKLYA
jgi:O-antigen/teichoic acid export membrane protein